MRGLLSLRPSAAAHRQRISGSRLWLPTVPSTEFRSAASCTAAQCSGNALGLTAHIGPNECKRCATDVAESQSILKVSATGTGTIAELGSHPSVNFVALLTVKYHSRDIISLNRLTGLDFFATITRFGLEDY